MSDDIFANAVDSRDARSVPASVGKDLSDMMKVGRKYGMDMDAMAVSKEIQGSMPIWYHRKSYAERSVYNSNVKIVKCQTTGPQTGADARHAA